MKKIIVLGLQGSTSLGVIRSLEKKYFTIGIDLKNNKKKELAYYSKYLNQFFMIEDNFDVLYEFLITKFKDDSEVIIIPTEDRYLDFFNLFNEKLSLKGFKFPNSKSYTYSELVNKENILNIVKEIGVEIPKKIEWNKDEIMHEYFPLILKPIKSTGYSKDDFVIFNSNTDLEKYGKIPHDFYLEEFIEGDTTNMFEVFAYSDSTKISVPCVINKIRQFPPIIGSSSYIKTVSNDTLSNITRLILKELRFNGIVDVEFKYCKKRAKYFFIEVNLRPGAPVILSKISGVNIIENWLENEYDYDLKCKPNYTWNNDMCDYKNMSTSRRFMISVLADIFRSDSYAVFYFRDPKPFMVFLKEKIINVFNAIRVV